MNYEEEHMKRFGCAHESAGGIVRCRRNDAG